MKSYWKNIYVCVDCGNTTPEDDYTLGLMSHRCTLCDSSNTKYVRALRIKQYKFGIPIRTVWLRYNEEFVGYTYKANSIKIVSQSLDKKIYEFIWYIGKEPFKRIYINDNYGLKIQNKDKVMSASLNDVVLDADDLNEWFEGRAWPITDDDLLEFILKYG